MFKEVVEITVAPELLWFILFLVLLFFIFMTIVFTYHWKHYGVGNNPKIYAQSIYWIVSIILIIIMAGAITFFEYL